MGKGNKRIGQETSSTESSGGTDRLVLEICRYKWLPEILILVAKEGGGRFARLVRESGAGRDTMSETLTGAIEMGLLARNPGYGHPLRPEYIATDLGKKMAASFSALFNEIAGTYEHSVDRKAALRTMWAIPVVLVLKEAPHRFNRLKERLGITSRSLTLTLDLLEKSGIVLRHVSNERPVTVFYSVNPGLLQPSVPEKPGAP